MRHALALAALLAPLPAAAQVMVDATAPEQVRNIASGWGSATLATDVLGDPMIRGRIEGTQYLVHFYGCTDGADCKTIQFRAGWLMDGVPLEAINAWNRERRFGKAYLDAEGQPVVEMNLNLAHGVSTQNLDATFGWWAAVLDQFADHLSAARAEPSSPPGTPARAPDRLEGVVTNSAGSDSPETSDE